ncbi:ABC transporter permease [Rhodoplanes roseus]|uniref:ABC transporter permease n=1 Tax=Rhodoplanes roseus TaxID=29409 RepID=A0A327L9N0_9BRAD|nr:ABC transporter permease [Rhodoplanes roseus]RAI44428.1 ABC transporter permease [Rhodoplanes roseus]
MRAFRLPTELWTLAALLALWEAVVVVFRVPEILVPSVRVVFDEIASNPDFYLVQSMHTLSNTLAAFVLSVVFGVGMAIAIVSSRFLEKTLYTVLVALNNVPKVALAPLFVIWLGTGNASKIAMGVMISIFAIVIDAVLGLRSLTPDMIDLGRSMRGSGLKMLLKLRLPNALPSIIAGMKVAMSLSLVGAIVGEFVAAQNGLGFVILSAQGMFRTDRVFAAILLLAAIGTTLYYLMEVLERALIPWHESQRHGTARAPAAVVPKA